MKRFLLKALVFLVGAALGLGIIFGFTKIVAHRYSARANAAAAHSSP